MISLKDCCIQCRPLLQRHAVFCPVSFALLLRTNKMKDWKRFKLKNRKYQGVLNVNSKTIQALALLWSTLPQPLPIICLTPWVLNSELMVSCDMICQMDPGHWNRNHTRRMREMMWALFIRRWIDLSALTSLYHHFNSGLTCLPSLMLQYSVVLGCFLHCKFFLYFPWQLLFSSPPPRSFLDFPWWLPASHVVLLNLEFWRTETRCNKLSFLVAHFLFRLLQGALPHICSLSLLPCFPVRLSKGDTVSDWEEQIPCWRVWKGHSFGPSSESCDYRGSYSQPQLEHVHCVILRKLSYTKCAKCVYFQEL